jgi:tricorn protease
MHFPRTTLLFAFALGNLITSAQTDPLWLRNGAISPDGKTIAFCYQGDIWRVPTSGGDAVPLTTNEAYDYQPVWSHDGAQIAFASMRHGSADVFVMSSTGGAPTRLTFHSSGEAPQDFSPEAAWMM